MAGNILTVLSAGTYVRGDVFSQDTLVVEGGIEGNLVGNRVIIKRQGWVHGNLSCRALSIEPGGVVDGDVHVSSSLSLEDVRTAGAQALAAGAAGALPGDRSSEDDTPVEFDLDLSDRRDA